MPLHVQPRICAAEPEATLRVLTAASNLDGWELTRTQGERGLANAVDPISVVAGARAGWIFRGMVRRTTLRKGMCRLDYAPLITQKHDV